MLKVIALTVVAVAPFKALACDTLHIENLACERQLMRSMPTPQRPVRVGRTVVMRPASDERAHH